jgi:hypothetical protein
MKRLFVLSLFLFSISLFAQPINYETLGNAWVWNIFSQGTGGSFGIVANPSKTGLNTSDSCAMMVIGADGDRWAGVWCADFPDLTLDASNCIIKILVYKNVSSPFNLKLEPPNVDHFDSNTVVNQWQELTFDYTSHIGTKGVTLTVIPDMERTEGPRTHASVCYWDNIRFTSKAAQQTVVDWETVGQDWGFFIFGNDPDNNTGYTVVANPSMTGINTSAHCGKFVTNSAAQPWAGFNSGDLPDFTITAATAHPTIMVYRSFISDFNLKLEGAGSPPNHDVRVPNTKINEWEKLTFDYTSDIGKLITNLTLIPDHSADPRTNFGTITYFDNLEFGAVIPVELTSFTASVVGNSVQLQWATATETNNQGFEIQRGTNNRDLVTVGFVKGNGTTTEQHSYSYVDNNELMGPVYYRLKQIDFNGKYDYSNVVEVTKAVSYALSQNYPNPFNPTTAITYSVPQSSFVTLKVYNVLGSEVADLVNGVVEAGVHKVNFNGYDLTSGVYFYTIKAGNFSETKKLMLMK